MKEPTLALNFWPPDLFLLFSVTKLQLAIVATLIPLVRIFTQFLLWTSLRVSHLQFVTTPGLCSCAVLRAAIQQCRDPGDIHSFPVAVI